MLKSSRHGRFLLAFGFGGLIGLAAWVQGVAPVFCILTAASAFFVTYLTMMLTLVRKCGPAELRRHADRDDEGVAIILVLAIAAVAVSAAAIYLVLGSPTSSIVAKAAALLNVPLGWATVHTLAAFHYAYLYYRGSDQSLTFPGKGEPGAWDFLYLSFTVGMTAQVSDVVANTQTMRRTILIHGVASFFYNTGILALAVNAVVTAGG